MFKIKADLLFALFFFVNVYILMNCMHSSAKEPLGDETAWQSINDCSTAASRLLHSSS